MSTGSPIMSKLTLVSHALCPYVQRAAIALLEKEVPFERAMVDLADKPEWFLAVSPLGRVPLLCVPRPERPTVLFESDVICEYVEETQAGLNLHPEDPLRRAEHRSWMAFGSTILVELWGLETAQDPAIYDGKRKAIAAKLMRVEAALGEGPYFAGDRFSLVDAAYAPIFRYFDVFDRIADTRVFAGTPKVRAWRVALSERPSVQSAVGADYAERLHAFLVRHDAHLLKLAA